MASLNPRHTIRRIVDGADAVSWRGDGRGRRRAARAAMFDRFSLPPACLGRYPHELSGGQRQRVGIARAALLAPDFVLADEIVSGLDVSTQAQALNLLKELSRDLGLAMAFISHDLSVIRAVCDRVYVLRQGSSWRKARANSVFARRDTPTPAPCSTRSRAPRIDPGWLQRDRLRTRVEERLNEEGVGT